MAQMHIGVMPNKNISEFRVTGLKSVGRVGTYISFSYFFLEKDKNLCILKGISPYNIFPRKPEKTF